MSDNESVSEWVIGGRVRGTKRDRKGNGEKETERKEGREGGRGREKQRHVTKKETN